MRAVLEELRSRDEINEEREEEARKLELRRDLVRQLHGGEGLDVEAAYEVRKHGWTH